MDETSITYDYEIKQVRVFTDREGVKNGILRRLGDVEGLSCEQVGRRSWQLCIPMSACRGAEMITRLINPDERTPMSDEQKAALRAANAA